jgi:hypothetical protein
MSTRFVGSLPELADGAEEAVATSGVAEVADVASDGGEDDDGVGAAEVEAAPQSGHDASTTRKR